MIWFDLRAPACMEKKTHDALRFHMYDNSFRSVLFTDLYAF